MPVLLYVDNLVWCGKSEEDLKTMVGRFVEVIVLGGEERLEHEVCVDGIRSEHVSEFKYLGYVLDESGT